MNGLSSQIDIAIEALKKGALVAVPTETVYGLAAYALNTDAVRKVFQVKGRPFIDPLIIHIHDIEQVKSLATPTKHIEKVLEHFWPGPLTVILKKKPIVPDIVTAGLDTVAIRMPKHPVFRELLKKSGLPLAAPSANPFGYLSPTEANHVKRMLGDQVAHILDGGPCEIGLESTIVDLTQDDKGTILRPGPIGAEELEKALGVPVRIKDSPQDGPLNAPGMLKSHYSPGTPLFLIERGGKPEAKPQGKTAIILNARPSTESQQSNLFWLSENGNLEEMAKNLFKLLQHLDQQDFDAIFIEIAEAKGIGLAINNRLERAASKD